ncbi:site-specific tyrosine recombinase XerC [Pelotomaculum sp. FP]|uniref:tyrosine-type recombinase/integrase n=1 Tax=Pelotomaculum sp. FP TaxID=261474 RepID=UPI001065E77F|nr:hypothetical protein [Pelotomaculum sp. FP]TEB11767.1 site-specific tyrosine recombinase XerC [Pelotomaculum sp. FP]
MYQYLDKSNEILDKYLMTIPIDSMTFYRTRINKFFTEYMTLNHRDRPINTISYYEINTFIDQLDRSDKEKLNYYVALNNYFSFAYKNDLINKDIMKGVKKPITKEKPKKYIDNVSINKLINYVHNDTQDAIIDRLLVAFFLYTGLSRKYIANLTNYQISLENRYCTLHFDMGTEIKYIPIKKELVDLIKEYRKSFPIVKPYDKIFSITGEAISKKIKRISKEVTGNGYTPTIFSNTFIRSALMIDNDILSACKLTLESETTIKKHLNSEQEENLLKKQIDILNVLFK